MLPKGSSGLPWSHTKRTTLFPKRKDFFIWPCFGWGLPCSDKIRIPKRDRQCYHCRGRLLPCLFTFIRQLPD